jgi:hypothetical protein
MEISEQILGFLVVLTILDPYPAENPAASCLQRKAFQRTKVWQRKALTVDSASDFEQMAWRYRV